MRRILPWLFAVLVVVMVYGVWRTWSASLQLQRSGAPSSTEAKLASQVTVFPADPVKGNASAPVTIIEFSDFECPYCAEVAPVLSSVLSAYPAARLVWKDFPLSSHPQARAAAEAAQCAAQQGKFWEYHDLLFTNQDRLGTELYGALARQLNLAQDKFAACLSQQTTAALIDRNVQEGRNVGVDATPYFIIGGQVHSGTITAPELEALINSGLGS